MVLGVLECRGLARTHNSLEAGAQAEQFAFVVGRHHDLDADRNPSSLNPAGDKSTGSSSAMRSAYWSGNSKVLCLPARTSSFLGGRNFTLGYTKPSSSFLARMFKSSRWKRSRVARSRIIVWILGRLFQAVEHLDEHIERVIVLSRCLDFLQ